VRITLSTLFAVLAFICATHSLRTNAAEVRTQFRKPVRFLPGTAYERLRRKPRLSSEPPKWIKTGTQEKSWFGNAVAAAGDVNGDGFDDMLVGVPFFADSKGERKGRVELYLGSTNGLSQTPVWTAMGEAANSSYGNLAGIGDINGDGLADFSVTAANYSGEHFEEGKVYVYFGTADGSPSANWVYVGREPFGRVGVSVAGAGDLNGDGFADLLIVAEGGSSNGAGELLVFYGKKKASKAPLTGWLPGLIQTNFSGRHAPQQGT
jgi:hypothetical protein